MTNPPYFMIAKTPTGQGHLWEESLTWLEFVNGPQSASYWDSDFCGTVFVFYREEDIVAFRLCWPDVRLYPYSAF